MNLNVTYEDGEPTKITSRSGHVNGPVFQFDVEDNTAILDTMKWTHHSKFVTKDEVRNMKADIDRVVGSVYEFDFIEEVVMDE